MKRTVFYTLILIAVFWLLPGSPTAAETVEPDLPDFWLTGTKDVRTGDTFEVRVMLSGESNVAAADFTVAYDPSVLTCAKPVVPTDISSKGSTVVVNKNYDAGLIKFSFVNPQGLKEDQHLLTFEMKVTGSRNKTDLLLSGDCVTDKDFQPVSLDYIPFSLNITVEQFHVTFLDWDGSVLSEQKVAYMNGATTPEYMARKSDDRFHYVFCGWDKDFSAITQDLTVSIVYTPEAHRWDKGTVNKLPSADEAGEKVYTCALCGIRKTESLPPTGIHIVFEDVRENDWFAPYVNDLVGMGIINGKGTAENGNPCFDPQGMITRGEFSKILAFASGEDLNTEETGGSFADVKGHWAEKYINWANQKGIVTGFPDGTFQADQSITREQIAVMLVRFAEYKGVNLPEKTEKALFADDSLITWSSESVYTMQKAGVINGKPGNLFDPRGNASRAEAAKMVSAFLAIPMDGKQ